MGGARVGRNVLRENEDDDAAPSPYAGNDKPAATSSKGEITRGGPAGATKPPPSPASAPGTELPIKPTIGPTGMRAGMTGSPDAPLPSPPMATPVPAAAAAAAAAAAVAAAGMFAPGVKVASGMGRMKFGAPGVIG